MTMRIQLLLIAVEVSLLAWILLAAVGQALF